MSSQTIVADLLQGGWATLVIATGAWIVSALSGLLLALAGDLGPRPARWTIATTLVIMRSVPQLVLLYLVFFGLPSFGVNIAALPTAIAVLGIADGSFNAEYYRASLMTVPVTQREAGLSLGFSSMQTFRLVVLPQAMEYMAAPLLNSYVSLLKTATLASAIGVPEILYRGQNDMQTSGQVLLVVILIVVIYTVVTMPLSRLVVGIERRTKERAYT